MNYGHLLTDGQNATEGDRHCQEKNATCPGDRKGTGPFAPGRKTVDRFILFVLAKKAIFFTIQEEQSRRDAIPGEGVLRRSGVQQASVTLYDVMDILNARLLVGRKLLGTKVETAFSADLLSDVLAYARPGSVLLTGLTNPQVVRTASVLDIAAIIIVRGKTPPAETLRLGEELEIPILATHYILFESSGRLYKHGIVGCIQKVGPDEIVAL